ncbi:ABC transporter permease [Paraburkholderia fungorum]|jgi:ribose transport system permease protein|uniref:Ribose transport system permease protein n=1 Tax=Paraburkholderia fungorum TaxID=134537 RepID=A0AAW3VBB8_9BURK|nr:ABC transporter permease [Paraburkholderia fungorum]MBB4519482.1 ribose transport system permease protein [Paraburkholderia fungorum]MBB6207315.1 ribose transport system permease protein [Paraburkholderia fungorum]PZR47089.1 MAG: ABC transporter permease [Paraburkholderia fungorum]QLD51480.1 ABC transporter permease [Paraburkholderia fungorum]
MNDSVSPMTAERQASPPRKSRMRRIAQLLLQGERPYALYGAFAILLVVFSFASPWFLSIDNFLNIGRQTALVSIIAVGMTFVIIARQIDLSVGSTLALSGMSAALAMSHVGDNWIVGAIAGIGTGALVGAINGVVSTRLNIPSFLVTLGTLSAARGLALMVTTTRPEIITNDSFIAIFGEGDIAGVPVPIIWTVLTVIAGILLLHYSVFGRQIYAAGGNPTAALYSGINTRRVTTLAFILTGMLAGLAALVLSARSHAARPDVVQGMELDVIASVTLGGCSLFGGRGFVLGTLLGSLIIGTLNNGLVLLGVSSSLQLVIKGAIIVAAVAFTRK